MRLGDGCTKLIFVLVGLALIAGGIWMLYQRSDTSLLGERAEGTVVRLIEKAEPGETPVIYPFFKFKAENGKTYTVKGGVGSNPAAYTVGEKLSVVYDPDRPQDAHIDSFTELWLAPLVLLLMGFIFVLAGLFGRVQRNRC